MVQKISFLAVILSVVLSCNTQVTVNNIEQVPKVVSEDEPYANVFAILDGVWKGEFFIYEDTVRGQRDEDLLKQIQKVTLNQLPLKQVGKINVKQTYQSESPYFQRVEIEDYYPEKQETIKSKGVNKVQDGKMWCVVQKPDELIIHEGSTDGPKTIIWQRGETSPQRVEYFRETVTEKSYEIIGWGYYEGDDLQLMPRFWFYSKYLKQ